MGGGAWCATVHGVAKSRARLNDFTFTFHFHALEKEMAKHSSVLDWRISGTGEPGGLLSMGSQSRIRLKRLSSSSFRKKSPAGRTPHPPADPNPHPASSRGVWRERPLCLVEGGCTTLPVTRTLEVDLPAPAFKASQGDLVLVQSGPQGAPRLMLPVCGRVSSQDELRSAICVPGSAQPGLLGGRYPSSIDPLVSSGGRSYSWLGALSAQGVPLPPPGLPSDTLEELMPTGPRAWGASEAGQDRRNKDKTARQCP